MTESFRPSYFMLVPTMACQASCKYCFAKKQGEIMSMATLEEAADFIGRISPPEGSLHIVFHGGEPLLAGAAFYETALPLLRKRFGARLRLSVQSNLWALGGPEGDRLAELLMIYDVSVGTSLDGPREMCDAQRGEGYYDNTTAGIEKLRGYGIEVSKICTVGKHHAGDAAKVFAEAESNYALHGAIPSLPEVGGSCVDPLTVSVEQMTDLFLDTYEAYRNDPAHARVSTIDSMALSCFRGEGTLCTFRDCLGGFAAIAPDGQVYSCQRFNGCGGFSLGSVNERLTEEDILQSPAYKRLKAKQDGMKAACGDCSYYGACKGGCLYSAFAGDCEKDPCCEAYKAVFDRMKPDMALEMAQEMKRKLGDSPESSQKAQVPPVTPLLSMVGDRPHPRDEFLNRERLAKAIRDGKSRGFSPAALQKLSQEDLVAYSSGRIECMYFNMTYRCPLRCTHCSASTGSVEVSELDAATLVRIVGEAVDTGVKQIEFTGGEPFIYPEFDKFIGGIAKLDRKGTRFIFRTSFGYDIPPERVAAVGKVFDTVIVSMDGDEAFHDRRRGKGVYQKTVGNLRAALALKDRRCDFGLWAVLPAKERTGKEGQAVKALAAELGIGHVTFRPLLPIGKSCDCEREDLSKIEARIPSRFYPRYSCGLGSILSMEPDGRLYPCYAWRSDATLLGRLSEESLSEILSRGGLAYYRIHGVDTNEKCAGCDMRYLCGGMCKAAVSDRENFDSGEFNCDKYEYYKRIAELLEKRR